MQGGGIGFAVNTIDTYCYLTMHFISYLHGAQMSA